MIDTFRFALVHPKMLGSLIVDKTIKPVLILIVMFLINVFTIFGMNYKNIYLTNAERSYIANIILDDETQFINFSNNSLDFKESQYQVFNFNLQFGESLDYKDKGLSLIFTKDSVKTYYYQFLIKETSYSEYNFSDFEVSHIDKAEFNRFSEFLQVSFESTYPLLYVSQTIVMASELLISFLMAFFLVFLITNSINRQVLGVLRIRLLMYSFISFFFLEWLNIIFELDFLSLISYLVPLVYFNIALRNILSVKRNINIEK